MPMSLNSMAVSELVVVGFAWLLQIAGWVTGFVAQTYAEDKGVFDTLNQLAPPTMGNLLRVVWMAIWAELILVFLLPILMFSKLRLHMLTMLLSTAGVALASIATSATIYLEDLHLKAVTATACGYLLMAIANGLTLLYYAIAYDNQPTRVVAHPAEENVQNKA
ncbi:hypothetical protein MNAN1_003597 [Malassezia nana]|uniref:Uncharacterized protein n=1 Tax=Malassezia nana TaxID=180528 RepID=A0AAF0J483_9BASI|nr:hypothetical protein MNAN1_003597 [Malassezia nana]